MKRLLLMIALFAALLFALTAQTGVVFAQPEAQFAASACAGGSFFGFQPWWAFIPNCVNGGPAITSITDIWKILLAVVGDAILLAGYLAGFYVLWGGIQYVRSRGNPGETAAAQATIQNAVIGLIIAIVSVAIVQFVGNQFTISS